MAAGLGFYVDSKLKESLSTTMHCALRFVYTWKFNMIINSRSIKNNRQGVQCRCLLLQKLFFESLREEKCQTPTQI